MKFPNRTGRTVSWRAQQRIAGISNTFFALLLLAIALMPFYLIVTLPMKSYYEVCSRFWQLPRHWSIAPILGALRSYAGSFGNTAICVLGAVSITLVLSMLGGYVFARMQFPGKETLYILVLAFMMIPSVLLLTPQYTMARDLGLYDSYWSIILPWAAAGQVWGIPLVRNHMESIPQELFDSARIDGAGDLQSIRYIALPLCGSILATVTVLKVTDFYNDFIWPLLMIQRTERQVVMYYMKMYSGGYAGYAAASIPLLVLFLFTSRFYMEGLTVGAVKQ